MTVTLFAFCCDVTLFCFDGGCTLFVLTIAHVVMVTFLSWRFRFLWRLRFFRRLRFTVTIFMTVRRSDGYAFCFLLCGLRCLW